MFILQFSDKPFMIKVLGKETWVEKEGEGKGTGYLFSRFLNKQHSSSNKQE
jgi:hypothetical protein